MRAVVARLGSDEPIVVDLDRPPIGAGEVRVAVVAAAFTYFDAFVPTAREALGLPDEVGLGFDFSGTITEIGAGVSGLAVGDRVAGLHTDITAPIRAHTDELTIAATAVAPVPDALALDVAAAVPLSALTARQALDLLGPERGRLLVTGAAGAVGGWLLELAARDGWDVTALVRPGTEELVEASEVVSAPAGSYDAVVDAAALHGGALALVVDGGRYVGFKPNQPQPPERGITVHTVQVVADREALEGLLQLAAKGEIPIRIAGRAPLIDAPTVYQRAPTESGARGRWLLIP